MKFKVSVSLLTILITTLSVFSQNNLKNSKSKSSVQRTTSSDGLVAYYPFDENEKDFSGFGNDANFNLNVLFTNKGLKNNSANFTENAQTKRIEIPSSSSLKFSNEFTFSGWYNFSDFVGNNGYVSLFAKSGYKPGMSALYNFETNTISLSNSLGLNQSVSTELAQPFEKGIWYHLVFTIKDDVVKIYVNGKNEINQSVGVNFDFAESNEQLLALGSFGGTNCCWYPFDGFIDEVKIYNKALDVIQVNDIYNTTLCQIAKPEITDVNNCVGEEFTNQFQEKNNPNYSLKWYQLEGEIINKIDKPILYNSSIGDIYYFAKNDSNVCNSEFLKVWNSVNETPIINSLSATINQFQSPFFAFSIQDEPDYTWLPKKPSSDIKGTFNGTYYKTSNSCKSKSEQWMLEVTGPIDNCQGQLPSIDINFSTLENKYTNKLYVGDTIIVDVSGSYGDEMCQFKGTSSFTISDETYAQLYDGNKLILLKEGSFSINAEVFDTLFSKSNTNVSEFYIIKPFKNVEPISTIGYNADVIADLSNSASATTNGAFDELIGNIEFLRVQSYGYSLYAKTNTVSGGLPDNGKIESVTNKGIRYQLQDYNKNNSLQLVASSEDTLKLETPKAYEKIFVLGAGGNGESSINMRIIFEDNSYDEQNFTMNDWYDKENYAINSLGRVSRANENIENSDSNPRLYDHEFTVPESLNTKKITHIIFVLNTIQSNVVPNVMAISGIQKSLITNATALHFDGVNNYISVDSTIKLPVGDKAYTLQAKIKPTQNGDLGIIGYGDYQVNNKVNALRLTADGGLVNYWWSNDLGVSGDTLSNKGINLTDGNWHDVASTYDGVKRRLYIDGKLVGEDAPIDTLSVVNTKNVTIGVTNNTEFFKGGIDEVRIWNRALCKTEIVNNLNCETPANKSGLILNYHFNQGFNNQNNDTITNVFDSSINGLTGKLINFDLTADTISNWFAPAVEAVSVGSTCNGFNITTAPIAPPAIEACKNSGNVNLFSVGEGLIWYNSKKEEKGTGTPPVIATTNVDTLFKYITRTFNGCESNRTKVEIRINPLPNVIATATDSIICDGDTVTLKGSGADIYQWFGASDNVPFVPEETKYYKVRGKFISSGCIGEDSIKIIVNDLPIVSANISKSTICVGDSVKLFGKGAEKYSWDNGVKDNTFFVINSSSIFNVIGTDTNGCRSNSSIEVNILNLPFVNATVSKSNICVGDSISVTAEGASSYIWSNGVKNNELFKIESDKKLVVTGTDFNNCKANDTLDIVVNQLPTINFSPIKPQVCIGDSITLNASGSGLNYTWEKLFSSDIKVAPAKDSVFNVETTDINGCKNIASINVKVNQLPTVTVLGAGSICLGGNGLQLTASGGKDYKWLPKTGLNNPIISNPIANPIVTTKYTVTATDTNGCVGSSTAEIVIDNNSTSPTLTIVASDTSICKGEDVKLTASGNADLYLWNNAVKNDTVFTPTSTKTYVVTATNSVTNCSVSDSIKVQVNQLPKINILATKTEICLGDSLKLTATGDADKYQWNNLVKNDTVFSPTITKTYKVTATILASNCSASDSVKVVVNQMPQLNISSTKSEVCFGDSLKLKAFGNADKFIWNNGVKNDLLFTPSTTKIYKVTATYNQSICSVSDSIKVVVNQLPNVNATVSKTSICLGDSVELKANGSALNYTWNNTIANNSKVKPLINTNYLAKGVDSNGCSDTASVKITVLPLPIIPTVINKTYCFNTSADTLKAVATSGNTLQWFASDSISKINNFKPNTLTPGLQSFFVSQKNVEGCESEKAKLTVEVLPKPQMPTFAQNNDTITIDTLTSKVNLNSITNLKKVNWIIEPSIAGATTDSLLLSTINWANKFSGIISIKAQTVDLNNCKSDTSNAFLLTRIGKANVTKKDTVINQLDSIIVTIDVNATLPVEISYTYVDPIKQTTERVLKNVTVNTTYIKIGANDMIQNVRIKDKNNVVVFVDSVQSVKNAGTVNIDLPDLYPNKIYFNDTIKLDLQGSGTPYIVTYKYNNVTYAKTVNTDKLEILLNNIVNDSLGNFELLSVKNTSGDTFAISGTKKVDFVFDVLNDMSVTLTDKSIPFCNEGTGLVNVDLKGGKLPYKAILKNKTTVQIDTLAVNIEPAGGYSIRQKSGSYSLQIMDATGYINNSLATQNITIAQSLSTVIENTKPVLAINTGLNPLNLLNGKDTSIIITANANTANPDTKLTWLYPSVSTFPTDAGVLAINGNVANLDWSKQFSGIVKVLIQGELFGCKTKYSDTLKLVYKPNVKYQLVNDTNKLIKYDSIAIDVQTFGKAPFRLKYTIKNGEMLTTIVDTIYDKKRIYFNYAKSISLITITDANGIETTISLTQENPLYDDKLDFYEAFSPNNDGENEYFVIGNYMDQKNTKFLNKSGELYVYDRNGFEVFRDLEYKNNWNAEGLTDGVYFYVFKRSDADKYGSFIEIRR